MSFIDFARVHGVDIDNSQLYPSDKIRRTGTLERPKSTNGAYFWDGQRGWVMDWSGEARPVWYQDPYAKPWTEEDKRQWATKRATSASAQEKAYERAAEQAAVILKFAKPDNHGYLTYKGFDDVKGLVLDDKLLVPMRNVSTNKLQGYQSIVWNAGERKYDKKMLYGMRSRNAVLYMGDRKVDETWLVEGFVTGLSLRAALKSVGITASVVVTFSASNLIAVADQVPGKRFVFADNDASGTGQKAAEETGLPWTMADKVGQDANDLHVEAGLFAVVAKIMDLRVKSS